MPATDAPQAPDAPPASERLPLVIDQTEEGWWAARVEGTGAFGQGLTRAEALEDLASALYDLNHQPTPSERALFRTRALWANLRDLLPSR